MCLIPLTALVKEEEPKDNYDRVLKELNIEVEEKEEKEYKYVKILLPSEDLMLVKGGGTHTTIDLYPVEMYSAKDEGVSLYAKSIQVKESVEEIYELIND